MAGSANQQNYGVQVQHISVGISAVVSLTTMPYQQGLWLKYESGPTLCYVGGSSLAAGGTFGMVLPSGASDLFKMDDFRGSINVVGATTTATILKAIRFFSAN